MNRKLLCAANVRAAIVLAAFPSLTCRSQTIEERLRALETQNETLRQQVAGQQSTIDQLKQRLGEDHGRSEVSPETAKKGGIDFGPVHLSGEGGVAYFHTGREGLYPSSTFRIDETKLFVEAPLWTDTYFYGELDLVTHEANDEFFHVGELYIDFENVLRHWTEKNWLSLRVGRVYIPFGEEYTARYVIDNPLISHSLSDLWGVDEGVELYGNALGFDYALAVQNGGHPTLRDGNGDKSVAGRLGYNFGKRARVSFSGIRTGELSVANDSLSELWFGGGFFRNIGAAETTSSFNAEVFELDAQTFWKSGHLKLAGGYFDYGDDDKAAKNSRDGFYSYAEGVQNLTSKLHAAARISQIHSTEGMPILGYGNFGKYFYGPLTQDIWRLSIGFGYRFSENLIAKVEYSFEQGELANGAGRRRHENLVGAELGFKF